MSAGSENLSGQVIRGGLWLLAMRGGTRFLGLVRTLILARLLIPDDFGLVGIAFLVIALVDTVTVTGFDKCLIQRQDATDETWDTAWVATLVRGALLSLAVMITAPWVAEFFGRPDGVWVIRVLALGPLIQGLCNLSVVRYVKEMAFHRQFVYQLVITLTDAVVGISLAIAFRNAWALVIGYVAGQVAGLLVSWLYHPVRVRLRVSREAFRDLFGFGGWITTSSILNLAITQGDDALVGRVLGATHLGWYQMAYRISTLPATELSLTVVNVTFSAYSKIKDSPERMAAAFYRVVKFTTMLSFPLGAMVALLAPDFVNVALGSKWAPMIPALQIMTVYGVIFSIGACLGPVFMAVDRVDLTVKVQFAKLVMMAVIIYPLVQRWGINGAALTTVICALIFNPVGDYLAVRAVNGRMIDFVKSLAPAIIIAISACFPLALLLSMMDGGILRLILGGVSATFFTAGAMLVLERAGMLGLEAEFKLYFDRKKGGI